MTWESKQEELPIFRNDHMSPWMMAPPEANKAFRKMQILEHERGFFKNPRIGDLYDVVRGVMTSANDIFLIKTIRQSATPGLIVAVTEGEETVIMEAELLRPLIRGEDISEFTYSPEDYIIWTHDSDGKVLQTLPNNAQQYFGQEDKCSRLVKRDDYKKGMPLWTIFRVSKSKLGQKAAWHELSRKMEAVLLPEMYSDPILGEKKLIVIQTVYFISSPDTKFCKRMVALLNSTSVRAFIKLFAERARGGYFRHISWTVGLVPLPKLFDELPINLRDQEKIDNIVSKIYGLNSEEKRAIITYDKFLNREYLKAEIPRLNLSY